MKVFYTDSKPQSLFKKQLNIRIAVTFLIKKFSDVITKLMQFYF